MLGVIVYILAALVYAVSQVIWMEADAANKAEVSDYIWHTRMEGALMPLDEAVYESDINRIYAVDVLNRAHRAISMLSHKEESNNKPTCIWVGEHQFVLREGQVICLSLSRGEYKKLPSGEEWEEARSLLS